MEDRSKWTAEQWFASESETMDEQRQKGRPPVKRRGRGRPRLASGESRARLGTSVSQETLKWIRAQRGSQGEVVDRLVAEAVRREEEGT